MSLEPASSLSKRDILHLKSRLKYIASCNKPAEPPSRPACVGILDLGYPYADTTGMCPNLIPAGGEKHASYQHVSISCSAELEHPALNTN